MVKQTWWMKGVIGIVIVLSGWVLYISSKQIERNRRIQEEVASLETEAIKIRRENETLSEKVNYFSSDDFREQEAKKKLGLKKMDETVVVISPRPEFQKKESVSSEVNRLLSGNDEDNNKPNYMKWWKLFFR
jgi:cell division protein FtsB